MRNPTDRGPRVKIGVDVIWTEPKAATNTNKTDFPGVSPTGHALGADMEEFRRLLESEQLVLMVHGLYGINIGYSLAVVKLFFEIIWHPPHGIKPMALYKFLAL